MMRLMMLAASLAVLTWASSARAQDTDEVKQLKAKIELLEAQLEAATLKIEKLEKENQQLQADAKRPGAASQKRDLSELLSEGKVVEGNYRGSQGFHGEITITISERDGDKFKGTVVLKKRDQDNKDLGTSEANIEGVINGARLSWTSTGSANRINATLTLRGEGLEGTFRTQAGAYGTVGLKAPK